MARGLLLSLLFAGLISIVAFSAFTLGLPKLNLNTNSNNSTETVSNNPGELVNQANQVAALAKLKNISTALVVYYSEQGRYPDSLNEISSYLSPGTDLSGIQYLKCSDTSVAIYSGSQGFAHNDTQATTINSPPSC